MPMVMRPGCFLASAINSLTLLAGTDGCTAITSVTTGKLVAQITPGNTARVYSVQVVNSDGKTSNLGSLTVQ